MRHSGWPRLAPHWVFLWWYCSARPRPSWPDRLGPSPHTGLTPEADVFLVLFLWNVVEKYVLCDCPSTVKSPVSKQSLLAADLQILFSSDMCCKSLEMDHLIVIIHITDKKQLMASSYQLPGGGRNFVPNIQLFQCCMMNRAIMWSSINVLSQEYQIFRQWQKMSSESYLAPTRSARSLSVCPSVCPSVWHKVV